MYDVFVSYRRRNAEGKEEGTHIARTIKLKLDLLMQDTDSRCFFDYSNMSNEDFPTRILNTIASAKVFVCVLTKNAMQRCGNEEDWVRREILQAKRCRLKIIFVNPDGQFTGEYPSNFPKELDFVRTTNHLTVHTDSSFDRDMRAIYDEEIQPILTHDNRVQQPQGALVRVHSDLECRVLDFGEEIATVGKGITEIRLAKGNHELLFISVESDAVRFNYGELDIRDLEYITRIKVRLLEKYNVHLSEEKKQLELRCKLSGKGRDGVYKVGDYYDDGTKQGVVFEVSADGKRGKIVSLLQSTKRKWGPYCFCGSIDERDGENNMNEVRQIVEWRQKYPAFAWCADLGNGWYLPAIEELSSFLLNTVKCNLINKTLKAKSAALLSEIDSYSSYWSSTENSSISAWRIVLNQCEKDSDSKDYERLVRAVSKFGDNIQEKERVYKVGDYYDDGKKQGVVFEVTADGQHGKIVSLTESGLLKWSISSEWERLIGADDKHNGANNMAKVQQIVGWREKYPAFAWCADLGEGWYLPAIEELKKFTLDDAVHDAVNLVLAVKGKKLANKGKLIRWYWSSTEYNEFCAWYVSMHDGSTGNGNKYNNYDVRAVSAF